ncbi:MAG: hypothetical protein Q9169_002638 [Polycauliona sp. 2 TL-2023]
MEGCGGPRHAFRGVVSFRSTLTCTLDDFEVAVFLTEISSRHAILHKEKRAKTEKPRLGTNPRLTAEGTQDVPLHIDDTTNPIVIREESQEEKDINLADIPAAEEHGTRTSAAAEDPTLFLSDDSDREADLEARQTRRTLQRRDKSSPDDHPHTDDKKKLGLKTSYDGFSIYGRILCLVVKRKGNAKGKDLAGGVGQAMMEDWIASTQLADEQLVE